MKKGWFCKPAFFHYPSRYSGWMFDWFVATRRLNQSSLDSSSPCYSTSGEKRAIPPPDADFTGFNPPPVASPALEEEGIWEIGVRLSIPV